MGQAGWEFGGPRARGGGGVGRGLREIAAPFVAAAPSGTRVRTRLRVCAGDAEVLAAAGRHLGSLAGRDLAARCAEGRLDAKGRAVSRTGRKRALTAESSSRWAGTVTRASEDAWQLAARNLAAERRSLKARVETISSRLGVPAGEKEGRTAGYATAAERHAKTIRLKALQARLSRVERQLAGGAVSVTRGGRRLMRARLNLAGAGLTEGQWRDRWDASRLFLTADGEKDKAQGNETIRWHPDEGWLEIKLPVPLAHLGNRPRGRYRLSCAVEFSHRGDEVAAQAASGAVRYDISVDPARGRWYIDASWKTQARPAAALGGLRSSPVVAVDVNAGHLAVAVLAPDGNVTGTPFTIPLELAGLPATARDCPRRARPRRGIRAHRHRQAGRGAGGRDRGPRLRPGPRAGPGADREPALARQTRAGVPAARRGHPHGPVPGQAGPDDRQRQPVRGRCRSGLHEPLGGTVLARPAARASPRDNRSPRRGAGDRETRARPPGREPRGREPCRPGGRGTASPGADPEPPGSQARTKETRRPTGHPAATAA
jgi:hypothetical protein